MKLAGRVIWTGMVLTLLAGAFDALAAEEPTQAAGESASGVAEAAAVPARPAQHELLVRAILERRLLHFSYHGHPRVVEPHAYGVSAEGEAVLHGYQTAGGSASEPPPGWRTFSVTEMSDITAAEAGFSRPRKSYTGERPKLDPLWAEVSAGAEPVGTKE